MVHEGDMRRSDEALAEEICRGMSAAGARDMTAGEGERGREWARVGESETRLWVEEGAGGEACGWDAETVSVQCR